MSLVELMVGLMVGLLVVLAASRIAVLLRDSAQHVGVGQRRAMNSGVMAGYLLQRDLRNAGVGLMNATQLACNTLNLYYNATTPANGAAVAPAQIADGGAGSGQRDRVSSPTPRLAARRCN